MLEQNLEVEQTNGEFDLLAACPDLRALGIIDCVQRAGESDCGVLINGETGVGKELAAKAIHEKSRRASGPFVVVDCGNQTENLVRSELFGHERGAFTGAFTEHRGHFECAHGGTLFLDEVGEFPLKLQPALLRVIDRKQFTRVGGTKVRHSDFRVVAATNKDLKKMVKVGDFREDLYYRLRVLDMRIPPLRERRRDVCFLANQFVEKYSTNSRDFRLDPSGMQLLIEHHWQGNVRELKNIIERGAAFANGENVIKLGLDRDFDEKDSNPADLIPGPAESGNLTLEALAANYPHKEALRIAERFMLTRALLANQGKVATTARMLGMHRRTLQTRLKITGVKRWAGD